MPAIPEDTRDMRFRRISAGHSQAPFATDRFFALARGALAYAAFLLLMLSLRPFSPASVFADQTSGGDRLNQIGFLIAGSIVAIGLLTLADRRRLTIYASATWFGFYVVLGLSVIVAPDPMAAARSVMLTLIGMLIASSIILLPPTETAFRNVSAAVLMTVLVISYAGFVLVPGLAIHGADGFEPQHAGLWRGPFTHKNIAGPVMSIFVMFGIYLWRRDMRITGFVVAILSLIFVLKTGSKTTNGLLPVAVMIVLAGRIVGSPRLTIALYVLAVVATGALTIGTVFSTTLSQIDSTLLGDPTFTGRSTLWTYGLQSFPEHFWLGTGYDSFWGTPRVTGLEPSYEWDWDFRGIVHGHSNYVDMLLTTGIVGTAILIAVLYVGPAVNYVRACRNPENRACADLFMMAMVFLTLLSFLETFFLRRVDPIWLLMMVSVTQLQVLARTGSEEPRTGAVPSL